MFTSDLIDLNNYIKCDFIKKKFNESYTIVNSIETADFYAKKLIKGEKINLLFEASYIKNYFFAVLKEYDINLKIVNCNCNYDRFINDFNCDNNTLYIFDNINNCKDFNILNIIKENKGILIC